MSSSITHLNDEQLFEVYKNALDLNLDEEFIRILEEEMGKRSIIFKKSAENSL
ncbi:sporulation histidine kinase inhibitor Sda [Salipaludibacillus sp. CUR1]|jgi:hypothetical protein|uniref:sporulation histidine kinase inhibitor Sda n=1 Tax=Salipaludibacillus sp. CUR1 TaxID=2820003 RepID=UPI001E448831|nr:sporulation histidine kinase inhibitor Sda [Salipaludibacillus sp. CUR1]MCE7792033.1 sporulation histidine kinase inhibitor Sda [Salipaludibacillus sp. CUR1]